MTTTKVWTDASPCPWAGKFFGRKMMEIPSTFLRWVRRECPWQIERFPGMAEYIASRLNDDVVCVRSQTREANTEGPPRGKTPKELGIKRGTAPGGGRAVNEASKPTAAGGDLFALAAAMREASR